MEIELIPRNCPFCGHPVDVHVYRDRTKDTVSMTNVGCNNSYCMAQPTIQMYGEDSQYEALKYWNGEIELQYE